METKANYVFIGILALAMSATIALFIIWKTKGSFDVEYVRYDIVFDGSVSGLSEASFVQFNGIKVGDIRNISWEPDDPNKVRVRIRVRANTPIKQDTVAQMAFQGVTGVTFVELTGGTAQSKRLEVQEGQEVAVIQSQKSPLQEMFARAPDMITQGNLLLLQFHKLLSDKNIESVGLSLENVGRFTGALAESEDKIIDLLTNVEIISNELAEASRNINLISENIQNVTASADSIMSGDAPDMIVQIRDAAKSIDILAQNTNELVEENKDALAYFTGQGLSDVDGLIAEMRTLVATLERLAQKLESDPSMLVSGSQYPEYEVEK
jgi:phospholipid/cholesterol/gamma-HCH transport system substrate-binding protein